LNLLYPKLEYNRLAKNSRRFFVEYTSQRLYLQK